ncbi:MAG TPA: phosphotransferase [Candidatus Angelobacter sp.]|nr:phosphotransferase [Candidatus Angelobacter sp.]
MASVLQIPRNLTNWNASPQTVQKLLGSLCGIRVGELSGDLMIDQCSATMLLRRPGSRHVALYKLKLREPKTSRTRVVEWIGKRDTTKSVGKAAREFRILQLLSDSGFGCKGRFRIPRPIHLSIDKEIILQEKARGLVFEALLRRGDRSSRDAATSAGTWLAKLHGMPITPGGVCSYEHHLSAVQLYVRELLAASPRLAPELALLEAEICQKLSSFQDVPLSLIHGDYHPQHIYVAGNRITVIDFDRSHFSDPAEDLGSFILHTRLAAIRLGQPPESVNREVAAFLKGYFAAASNTHVRDLAGRVRTFVALSCLEALYYVAAVLRVDDPCTEELYLRCAQDCRVPGLLAEQPGMGFSIAPRAEPCEQVAA